MVYYGILAVFSVKCFTHIYMCCKRLFKTNIKGLGWFLRHIKHPFIFALHGRYYYFCPKAAPAYGVMLAGYFNEPETVIFIERLLNNLRMKIQFIDVGASIGEIAIYISGLAYTGSCVAFEPIPDLARAVRISALINGYDHIRISDRALSSSPEQRANLMVNFNSPTESSLFHDGTGRVPVPVTISTLDIEAGNLDLPTVILIDVEGRELDVIKGGKNIIREKRPLLIFEYHEKTRRCFSLDDARAALPDGYKIFRLRSDGWLDRELSDTWNCCAVHCDSPFFKPCCELELFTKTEGV